MVTNGMTQNYFITTSKDSISCRRINFFDTNAKGRMVDFEYVNNNNETIRLKKNDIPEIQRLCQDGSLYLRMPLNIKNQMAIIAMEKEWYMVKLLLMFSMMLQPIID